LFERRVHINSRSLLYPRLRQRTLDEGHGRRLRRVAYSPSSSLSWTCCCCWNMGRACSAAAGGGSFQPSAIRSQSSANRSRAARVCSFSVACAASKQVLARRRYSSPLRVITKTPIDATNAGAMAIPLLDHPAEGAAGKWPREERPGGARLKGVVIQCSRVSIPRAPFQLASVKLVPGRRLIFSSP
jgi:hypothetical protein